MRVRHRPGLALTAALVFVFLLTTFQYDYVSAPISWRSEAQMCDCNSNARLSSIWPWRALQQQESERLRDSIRPGTPDKDPIETYPMFRELKRMPDPLYQEFVSWHGENYQPPPKPRYKRGHSPRDRKKALEQFQEALDMAAGKEDEQGTKAKDKTADNMTDKTMNKTVEEIAKDAEQKAREDREPKPIADPFPLLSQLDRASAQRCLPTQHNTKTRTPLLIGFTRNWPLLLQCVASYMAAGWPARDIYIVENTGTMGSNRAGRLSMQNPFFLNHTQLVDILGVHVIETPTLFTFAQLQNFYLYTAQQMGWQQYFWSHQDVVVFSEEGYVEGATSPVDVPFIKSLRSFHDRALATLKILTHREPGAGGAPTWATHFFDYDRLTLVNVHAYLAVGAWDPHISFYAGDCDMYLRLKWAGYWQGMLLPEVGRIFDVAGVLDNLGALFHLPGVLPTVGGLAAKGTRARLALAHAQDVDGRPPSPQEVAEQQAADLVFVVRQMHLAKNKGSDAVHDMLEPMDGAFEDGTTIRVSDRNSWQRRQRGGHGEPFYRDPEGFEAGLRMHIAVGRQVYADKWGHRGCDLDEMGIETEDAWHLERDWSVGKGNEGSGW